MFSLKGRVAIVTGGRGLYGAPISEGLAEAGAHVIVASRDREACDAFAAGLQGKGLSAEGAQLDLADERSVKALAAEVTNRHGRIDVLVNNAVSRGDYGDFETLTRERMAASLDVNILGLMSLTREVLKPMKAAGAGSIINISSIQGVTAPHFPYYEEGQSSPSGYTFEKWGLVGFTKWLAAMYGKDGIRANAVSPGGYHPQLQETRPRFYETYAQHTPLHKWPDRDDIKGPVCFLASDAARYVTGHNLVMDGGFTIW
ncbi:MAG: SDR family oxidoreductase [Clostridiales bacterium]|nr:SDR family oxidoreductase [Clostridiales bacterium]